MIDMPLQNMSQPVGMVVILLVDKSISAAPCGYCGPEGQPASVGGQLPEPETDENLSRVEQGCVDRIDRHGNGQSAPHACGMTGRGVTRLTRG